jgi:hypothetical protein
MQNSGPEVTGLPSLYKAVYDKIHDSSANRGKTWIGLAQSKEAVSSVDDIRKKGNAYEQYGPEIGISF